MKSRKNFPFIFALLLLPLMLFFTITLMYFRLSDKSIDPTLDISNLACASAFQVEGANHSHISIDGVEYAPYGSLPGTESSMDLSEIGSVFAYILGDGGKRCTYFAELKGLDREDWIIEFNDDGTGLPSQGNLLTVYRGGHVEDIPEQIERLQVIEYPLTVDKSNESYISIGGVEYVPYANIHGTEPSMNLSEIDSVFAYYSSSETKYRTCFAGLKGLAREDWIIEFRADGTGLPSKDNLIAIYKGVHVEEIPEQIQEIPVTEYYH